MFSTAIRILSGVILLLLFLTIVLFPQKVFGGGPTPSQPSEQKISQKTAHQAAEYIVDEYLASPFPPPYTTHVARCAGGPKVWRCPARVTARTTECKTKVLVWAGAGDALYVEYKQLRCYTPKKEK